MQKLSNHNSRESYKSLLLLAILWSMVGCQTKVLITSDPPGSNVFDGDKLIGITPLSIDLKELKDSKAGGHLIGIEKSGYHRVLVWMPGWINGLDVSLNMKPFILKSSENSRSSQSSASRRVVYANTASLFKVQNRVLSDRDTSPEVIGELDKQMKDNPTLGSLSFLKAVVLARQKKEDEAKDLLLKAMQMSPREYDFLSMYNILGGEVTLDKSGEPTQEVETKKP